MIITKEELLEKEKKYLSLIKKGAVFIYPTDTIYGIGCNAQVHSSVQKIRELKDRPTSPFSVIAPSTAWIRQNCVITKATEKWLAKLPGPYTLILPLKNKSCVAKEVMQDNPTLGVRVPDHWISKIVATLGVPIVTTSVNKASMPYMTSLEDMDNRIKVNVDFIVDEGTKKGKPSTIVQLVQEKAVITKRARQR